MEMFGFLLQADGASAAGRKSTASRYASPRHQHPLPVSGFRLLLSSSYLSRGEVDGPDRPKGCEVMSSTFHVSSVGICD